MEVAGVGIVEWGEVLIGPQGLKPRLLRSKYGTTEAVPFPKPHWPRIFQEHLGWRFSAAKELIGFSPVAVGKFFLIQDVKFFGTLLCDRLAEFAVDPEHRELASEDDTVALPSVRLQYSEEAFRECHHPAVAEGIEC